MTKACSSGVVEAGCKTIIGRRLKQSGMRWTVRGANAIIALRRCDLSGRWEQSWEARVPVAQGRGVFCPSPVCLDANAPTHANARVTL